MMYLYIEKCTYIKCTYSYDIVIRNRGVMLPMPYIIRGII